MVLALVAILSVVVVMTLNPAELIRQARDSNRLSDLATINTALNLFSADVTSGFMGTSTIVYISIPDISPTCANLGLPTSTVYTYNCVTTANLRNTNGTGWIPVNFERISSNSPISQLPIDPTNATSSGNYYTYMTGGSWELASNMESVKQKSITGASGTDGGVSVSSYEIGNNLRLIPSGLLEWKRDSSLVGYWTFDEGDGARVKDYSGYGNNGTMTGGTLAFATGKVGLAGDFISPTSYTTYLNVPDNNSLDISENLTISVWINYISTSAGSATSYPLRKYGSTSTANFSWYWYSIGAPNPNGNVMYTTMGGSWNTMNTPYQIAANSTWRHFVQTYSASGSRNLYLNGILVGSIATNGGALSTNNSNLAIGQLAQDFRLLMDDVRIYNRALSAAEVLAIYNATK